MYATEDDYPSVYGGNFDGYSDQLGLALPTVTGAISSLFGTRKTGEAVYREDGARWSAAKQYWELPPGTRATVQSPKPSGSGVQSMSGGPVISSSAVAAGGSVAPSAAPSPGAYQMPVVAGLSVPPLLIAGAAAVAIVMLTRRGRR